MLCGRSYGALPNAHYIGRAHGGMGIEENIITLCLPCHHRYDNTDERNEIREQLRLYLKSKYPDWDETNLIYTKWF